MPAQLKEVVVTPDDVQAECLRPNLGQQLFDRRPRRNELALQTRRLRIGQRAAVDLSRRRQWHPLDLDDYLGHHPTRQESAQVRAQFLNGSFPISTARLTLDVEHQTLLCPFAPRSLTHASPRAAVSISPSSTR